MDIEKPICAFYDALQQAGVRVWLTTPAAQFQFR
jgi:hypothetical protein